MAPVKSPLRRYYTRYEVAQHNTPDDCWVSIHGTVYDLTRLIKNHPGTITEPLIKTAGQDISHWFDPKTKDVRTMICPVTQLERPYLQYGPFPHVPPAEPVGNWDTSFGIPWWRDKRYQIGSLSQRTRVVRFKNVLTGQEDCLEVPNEESLAEIRERYVDINYHAKSYTFKALVMDKTGQTNFEELNMNLTLEENGVCDETRTFEDLMMPTDEFIPVIHAYWNDDLTVA